MDEEENIVQHLKGMMQDVSVMQDVEYLSVNCTSIILPYGRKDIFF